MQTVNIHEAKTQLSRLIALAGQGEPFIIAKAGNGTQRRRLGFMTGTMTVPDDFDHMGSDNIAALFAGEAA